jgi:hypothetical protein
MDAGLNIPLEGYHSAGTIPCFGGAKHLKNGQTLEQLAAAALSSAGLSVDDQGIFQEATPHRQRPVARELEVYSSIRLNT